MNNLEDYPKQASDPNFACSALADALGNDGKKLTFYDDDPGSTGNASISADSDNWELALNWLNFWSTEQGLMLARLWRGGDQLYHGERRVRLHRRDL